MRAMLIMLMVAASASAQPSFPLPRIVPLSFTNGTVMLSWNYGIPQLTTLSNVTTRTVVAAGYFEHYMVTGLSIGSTNTFVVFNEAGFSNMATGVAGAFIPRAEIRTHSFLVSVPVSTNSVSRVLTSTNMSVWTTVALVTNGGPTYRFIWTNDGGARYFRSALP